MKEIERKFLVVSDDFLATFTHKNTISQGYLNTHSDRTVRIRISDQIGYITVKGKSDVSGTTRFEWEKEIPLNEALDLLLLCEPGLIEKTRYTVPNNGLFFEVDVFHGKNQGLILAEIELPHQSATFFKPDWLGKEVTADQRFYNSYLSKIPFITWQDKL